MSSASLYVEHASSHAADAARIHSVLAFLNVALTSTLVSTLRKIVKHIFLLVQLPVSKPKANTSEGS